MSAPKHAHAAVIANRHDALSAEVAGFDIASELFDLLNDGEPEHAAHAVLEDVAHVLGPRPDLFGPELHRRLAQNALGLAWRMLRVIDMMDAARSAADAEFLKTKDLVDAAELAKLRALRKELDHATRIKPAAQSRRLHVVPKAPASKRGPVSKRSEVRHGT